MKVGTGVPIWAGSLGIKDGPTGLLAPVSVAATGEAVGKLDGGLAGLVGVAGGETGGVALALGVEDGALTGDADGNAGGALGLFNTRWPLGFVL